MPSSLQVGPHSFKVKTGKKARQRLVEDSTNGHAILNQSTIRIDTQRPHSQQAVTLLHEVLHAVWYNTSLGLTHDDEVQEAVVTALTPLLLDTFLRNPKLVEFLCTGTTT